MYPNLNDVWQNFVINYTKAKLNNSCQYARKRFNLFQQFDEVNEDLWNKCSLMDAERLGR